MMELPEQVESFAVSAWQYERLKSDLAAPAKPLSVFSGIPIHVSPNMPDNVLACVEPPKGPADRRPAWERTRFFKLG